MAAKKVGELIKEARTAAGLTQEKLGLAVNLTASEISKAERGELELTDAALKRIAKATGVTQASLLSAPKGGTSSAKSSKASSSAKTSASGKSAASAKKTAASTAPAGADIPMKVTSTEKKLIEYYRAANSATKKAGTKVLKGDCANLIDTINGTTANAMADTVSDVIGDLLGSILGGK